MEARVVGIDVGKETFAIAVDPTGESWTSATTEAAIAALVTRLQVLSPAVVVMEATGGYELPVAAACAGAGLPVAIVNPRQVRAFAQATGQRPSPIASMPTCWRASARSSSRRPARFLTRRPRRWPRWWRGAAN